MPCSAFTCACLRSAIHCSVSASGVGGAPKISRDPAQSKLNQIARTNRNRWEVLGRRLMLRQFAARSVIVVRLDLKRAQIVRAFSIGHRHGLGKITHLLVASRGAGHGSIDVE